MSGKAACLVVERVVGKAVGLVFSQAAWTGKHSAAEMENEMAVGLADDVGAETVVD